MMTRNKTGALKKAAAPAAAPAPAKPVEPAAPTVDLREAAMRVMAKFRTLANDHLCAMHPLCYKTLAPAFTRQFLVAALVEIFPTCLPETVREITKMVMSLARYNTGRIVSSREVFTALSTYKEKLT